MFITVAATLGCVVARAQVTQTPTSRPVNHAPVGGVIRGHVSIAGGAPLQRWDLTHVVVYIAAGPTNTESSATTRPTAERPAHAVVSQRNKAFVPSFVVVPRGTDVEFPNWDRFDHNVFSRSAAAPAFDLDRYPYGKSKTRRFDKLGVVQVFCNIHPQMRAVIFVTPDERFACCDADGNFQIEGLPPGTFEVAAWQERCDEQRQPIDVRPGGEPASIDFTLKPTRARSLAAADNRRATYGVERGLGVKREELDLPVVRESHDAPADARPAPAASH
jgi:plastocyanin